MSANLRLSVSKPAQSTAGLWPAFATAAVVLAPLIAYNLPPSATLINQACAIVCWASFLIVVAIDLPRVRLLSSATRGLWVLASAWVVCLLSIAASVLFAGLPLSLAASNAGMLLATWAVAHAGASAQRAGFGERALLALSIGLAAAAVLSALVGLVQFFFPGLADGNWIARSAMDGRAVGNMRQPNHLSSLLLWGIIAIAWLADRKVWPRPLAWSIAVGLVLVVVLSGSRTGALGMLALLGWGVLERRFGRSTRVMLVAMPLAYAAFWLAMSEWSNVTHHVFGGETRFNGQGDISSSRYGIWSNTLALIKMHPWFGVGFGEFNFAWTLTPFPGRPVAFFDHTHNLPLQFLVELGIPLGTLVIVLLLAAFWFAFQAVRAQRRHPEAPAAMSSTAFMLVLMIGLHSLLEYPLWYAYFLLPTAFAFGLCLGDPPRGQESESRRLVEAAAQDTSGRTRPLLIAALLMLGGGFALIYDYMDVVAIFTTNDRAAPLDQRIEQGRRSWFFSHHAAYAAATVDEHPSSVMWAFKSAPHYLLDTRLMMAWAKALDESGETDKARYVAQRLKEFRNPQAADFFAVCDEPRAPSAKTPFQCEQPTRTYRYEDFR